VDLPEPSVSPLLPTPPPEVSEPTSAPAATPPPAALRDPPTLLALHALLSSKSTGAAPQLPTPPLAPLICKSSILCPNPTMARSIWSTGRCWGISTALDAARPSCIGWGPAWPWSVPPTTPGPPTWKPWGGAPGYSRAMPGGPMNSKPADTAGFSSLLTGRPEEDGTTSKVTGLLC